MIVTLKYKGHDVEIEPPSRKGIEGKYVITIGNLVRAYPTVKLINKRRIRIYWDKNYGRRFNRLLQGAFNQFFREISE